MASPTIGAHADRVVAAGAEALPACVAFHALQQAGLLRKGRSEVKVLGHGKLNVALTVKAHRFTKSAVQKIEAVI